MVGGWSTGAVEIRWYRRSRHPKYTQAFAQAQHAVRNFVAFLKKKLLQPTPKTMFFNVREYKIFQFVSKELKSNINIIIPPLLFS
jgi:hypothetical protein